MKSIAQFSSSKNKSLITSFPAQRSVSCFLNRSPALLHYCTTGQRHTTQIIPYLLVQFYTLGPVTPWVRSHIAKDGDQMGVPQILYKIDLCVLPRCFDSWDAHVFEFAVLGFDK